ncbi:MAG: RNA-binding protein [Labilithrix sp.]|nr:RNA-binding protein [Labilithrix sp.]
MENRLYVGNLSDDVSSEALRRRFAEYGVVTDVHLATDRSSGRLRGHAFVTMDSAAAAQSAMKSLDGAVLEDRRLRVNLAGEDRDRDRSRAKAAARTHITSQFRERTNMVYELDCTGMALIIRMFPEDTHEKGWRLEASTRGFEGMVVSASAGTRGAALEELAREWQNSAGTRVLLLDWVAITDALSAVRAI